MERIKLGMVVTTGLVLTSVAGYMTSQVHHNPQIAASIKQGTNLSSTELASIQTLKLNWQEQLIGSANGTKQVPDNYLKLYRATLSNKALQLQQQLIKQPTTSLWPSKEGYSRSRNLTEQFLNLNTLALAYATPGTSMYHQASLLKTITTGFNFLTAPGRFDGQNYYGNWYDWQIAIPESFINSIMALGSALPTSEVQKYAQIIQKYVPNPQKQLPIVSQDGNHPLKFKANFVSLAGNRAHLSHVTVGLGILLAKPMQIKLGVAGVATLLSNVKAQDGFYPDNSFIAHQAVPYTGEYGNDLFAGVAGIYALVANSPWQASDNQLNNLSQRVIKAYLPVITNGEPMDIVWGRGAVRPHTKSFGNPVVMNTLLQVAQITPMPNKQIIQNAIRYWMVPNANLYLQQASQINDLQNVAQLLSLKTLITKPALGEYTFNQMARFVSNQPGYNFAISMYSKKISAYEYGNGENKHGWHMSDGMTYLYNGDGQFGYGYWATIDPNRLPGTTVDLRKLPDAKKAFATLTSNQRHVGGATDGMISAVGMAVDKHDFKINGKSAQMNLVAKKSWFTNGQVIVNLGAGITGNSPAGIATIVDNHQLVGEPASLVNANQQLVNSTHLHVNQSNWLLLKRTTASQNVGYLFPKASQVTTRRVMQTGSYLDVDHAILKDQRAKITQPYQQIIINHGHNVNNGSYAYTLVPNATVSLMQQLTQQPSYQVLHNTAKVQAVQFGSTIATNTWVPNQALGFGFYADNAISAVLKKLGHRQYTLTINNVVAADGIVKIHLPHKVAKLIKANGDVTVHNQTLSIGTDGLNQTITLQLSK